MEIIRMKVMNWFLQVRTSGYSSKAGNIDKEFGLGEKEAMGFMEAATAPKG